MGPWEPLTREETVQLMAPTGLRWWFTGGHALELHVGRSWRSHADVDVGILRSDVPVLAHALAGWDVQLAAAGRLSGLPGRPLRPALHENNLWVRRPGGAEPWRLDVAVSEGDAAAWVYRRDPAVRVPWPEAVLADPHGIPYLAPEIQLLHKSVSVRPKDDHDAAEVVPTLDPARRARLSTWLPPDHPWIKLLG